MKNLFFVSAFLIAPFILGAQTTVTRSLPAFEKIAISGGYDKVVLKQGDAESVQLETSGIDPDKIVTEVKGNTLNISTKNGVCYNFKAKITITYRSIRSIANSGSSDIVASTVIKADDFKLASSGSGDFKGEFDVKSLDVAISGSSDMKLSGKAADQDIAISGSGDVDAGNLSGESAEVAISGSGDVRLGVKGKVKTAVSGSGTVTNY